jgi:hypothetical protein
MGLTSKILRRPILKELTCRHFTVDSSQEISFLKARLEKHDNPTVCEKILKDYSDAKLFSRAAVLIPINFRTEVNPTTGQAESRTYFTLSKRAETMSSFKGDVSFFGKASAFAEMFNYF